VKRTHRCPLQLSEHGSNLCPLHKRLDEAAEHVEQSFAATTIAELLFAPGRSTPLCHSDGVPVALSLSSAPADSAAADAAPD
jgi:hypothetical protein